jgi:amino acid adenylation domain-containing protein
VENGLSLTSIPVVAGCSELSADSASVDAVPELVEVWARHAPDSCAVSDPSSGVRLSYAELWERAGWLAAELGGLGVGRGDVVAVAARRSADLVVAMLGIVRAGGAYLPLDSHAPAARVAAMLAEARTDLVVCVSSHRPGGDWPDLPDGLRLVPVPRAPGRHGAVARPAVIGGDDPVYVSYTSGSTGRPKGVVVPHRAVLRLAVAPLFCTLAPGELVGHMSNIAFDATTFEIWNTLTAGATVVILPTALDLPIDGWVAMLREVGVTTIFLTTSLFHLVARERPAAFASLRNLVVGGEQLDLAAVRAVLAAGPPGRLVNGYGPTETTTFAAYYDCTDASLAGLDRIPIGFPLQRTTLHVLDGELRPVPPGEVGELYIGGAGVATGYLARPDLTAERFVTDPATGDTVYRSGDLVRQLPGGALEMAGRRDRQVKLRGFRIELEEIERAAAATGLVDLAMVERAGDGPAAYLAGFVLPRRSGGPGAAGLDAAGPDAAGLGDELSRRLAAALPDYMVPARWVVLEELPLGPTGKADRARLLAMLDGDPQPTGPGGDPGATGDGVADAVRDSWQDVLAVTGAAPGDNFLDSGGNSLSAVQLAHRLQQRLGVLVEPVAVLLAASLAELVEQVRAELGPVELGPVELGPVELGRG